MQMIIRWNWPLANDHLEGVRGGGLEELLMYTEKGHFIGVSHIEVAQFPLVKCQDDLNNQRRCNDKRIDHLEK